MYIFALLATSDPSDFNADEPAVTVPLLNKADALATKVPVLKLATFVIFTTPSLLMYVPILGGTTDPTLVTNATFNDVVVVLPTVTYVWDGLLRVNVVPVGIAGLAAADKVKLNSELSETAEQVPFDIAAPPDVNDAPIPGSVW